MPNRAFCYAYSNNILFKLNHINSSALASATMASVLFFNSTISFWATIFFIWFVTKNLFSNFLPWAGFNRHLIYCLCCFVTKIFSSSSFFDNFLGTYNWNFWGAIFLNENIDQKVILGSLCILIGIGLTNIFKPKNFWEINQIIFKTFSGGLPTIALDPFT